MFWLCFLGLTLVPRGVYAAPEAASLRVRIAETNETLEALERDIKKYEAELRALATQRSSLTTALKRLRVAEQKLQAEIRLTRWNIGETRAAIRTLEDRERTITLRIHTLHEAIASLVRALQRVGEVGAFEAMLRRGRLAAFIEERDTMRSIQAAIATHLLLLKEERRRLQVVRAEMKQKLATLDALLAQQEAEEEAVREARRSRERLLARTQQQESRYKTLIEEKRAAYRTLQEELRTLQAQLSYVLDPSRLPARGILSLPFSADYIARCNEWEGELRNHLCITQYFGSTPFARSGAYRGRGHNGVDFRAPYSTKIYPVAEGVVRATGDTDRVAGCYSYGKWVLVDHPTLRLSSLYAHLSAIAVRPGARVSRATPLGLSGASGYATGPHLHLSLFPRSAVQVRNLASFYRSLGKEPTTPCARGGVEIPVAPLSAYLNPLEFLSNVSSSTSR